jgi:hypothetical protein
VKVNNRQWRYTNAPDAEMRIAQAMYWAQLFARDQKVNIQPYLKKIKKMGDFNRYCLFDKYFQRIGAGTQPGVGYNSCHYLVSWMVGWGGGIGNKSSESWAWRMGYFDIHSGYQNPMASWYWGQLGVKDWTKSTKRQLDLIAWVQSKEGAIGGGVFNDYHRKYGPFHGMQYKDSPVFNDPPSNLWPGWQFFLMERVAQYYYFTGDEQAWKILSKWVAWIRPHIKLRPLTNDVKIPGELKWSGNPVSGNLSVEVMNYNYDVGGMADLAMTLMFWDKANLKWKNKHVHTMFLGKRILNRMWKKHYDGIGVSPPEARPDYERFWTQKVYLPPGVVKIMPWGKVVKNGMKFNEIRPSYNETLPPKGPYSWRNPGPVYHYHRTWAQTQFATALAYVAMFEEDAKKKTPLVPLNFKMKRKK